MLFRQFFCTSNAFQMSTKDSLVPQKAYHYLLMLGCHKVWYLCKFCLYLFISSLLPFVVDTSSSLVYFWLLFSEDCSDIVTICQTEMNLSQKNVCRYRFYERENTSRDFQKFEIFAPIRAICYCAILLPDLIKTGLKPGANALLQGVQIVS